MADIFKLPASSYDELIKIIKAYASEKEGALLSLDDISQGTGMARTVVSGNNGFLVQIGLITEGNKKAATEKGRALGRAYTSKVDYEIVRIWKEIITEVDFLTRMVSAVRIRNGMDRNSFLNHIVYSSGVKDGKQSRTGAGAIIEVLKCVGVLKEEDGKLTVVDDANFSESGTPSAQQDDSANRFTATPSLPSIAIPAGRTGNSVVINFNINVNCTIAEIDELSAKIKELLTSLD